MKFKILTRKNNDDIAKLVHDLTDIPLIYAENIQEYKPINGLINFGETANIGMMLNEGIVNHPINCTMLKNGTKFKDFLKNYMLDFNGDIKKHKVHTCYCLDNTIFKDTFSKKRNYKIILGSLKEMIYLLYTSLQINIYKVKYIIVKQKIKIIDVLLPEEYNNSEINILISQIIKYWG